MLIVMKFGGSLLARKNGPSKCAEVVMRNTGRNKVVVVVSAIGDVTDLLLDLAASAQRSDNLRIEEILGKLRLIHIRAVRQLGGQSQPKLEGEVEELLEALSQALKGVSLLKELTPRSRDLVVSFGERLSAPIVAAAIQDAGRLSKALSGAEAGITTDASFGEAYPDFTLTRRKVKRTLSPLLADGAVPVVTGFIGATPSGEITTLGRGGSDYTATILADALDADEVWIWTDVDGIMTADPRTVPGAAVIKELSYAEAEEMAYFGAKNMHPLALSPARIRKIPVRIKNGNRTELPGTLIHQSERKKSGIAKAIMMVGKVSLLTISGETLAGQPGTAGRIFQALGQRGVNIFMISQSVSESNISLVVKRNSLQKAIGALEAGLNPRKSGMSIEADSEVAVLAAVGAGMKGTPGVAARVFGVVASRGINVKMIAQGSSELNISFVVRERDSVAAVRALHKELLAN
jgi:aspartate kinase